MEFLDPEEKKERTIRLFLGYGVGAALVILGTILVLLVLQGFDLLNRSSDLRNGLLFVDSKPVSSDIYIDNQFNKRTDARLVLPEGSHGLRLSEQGYRDWQKQIDIVGGKVLYQIYPRLFPVDIRKQQTVTYSQMPKIWTQSPDRKWIVVSNSYTASTLDVFETTKPTELPKTVTIPSAILNPETIATSTFSDIEWSSDNRRFIVLQQLADGTKNYLLIDRDKPEESINLTTRLNLPQQAFLKLRDKKYDLYYVLNSETKLLQKASLSSGLDSQVIADNVISFAPYGSNIVLYATTAGATEGNYSVRILDGSKSFLLQSIVKADKVLLDVARYDGDWYFISSSSAQKQSAVYLNPLKSDAPVDENGSIKPQFALANDAPLFISFSDNARFIGVQNKDSFAVYDAELDKTYNFASPTPLPVSGAKWMDGHRYHVVSEGAEQVFEFDGLNHQTLSNALNGQFAFYDRDYVRLFNLTPQADNTYAFQVSNLTLTD